MIEYINVSIYFFNRFKKFIKLLFYGQQLLMLKPPLDLPATHPHPQTGIRPPLGPLPTPSHRPHNLPIKSLNHLHPKPLQHLPLNGIPPRLDKLGQSVLLAEGGFL